MASAELMLEAKNPATTPARLQEIAQEDQSTWTAIAANPSAYPGLLEWLTEHGDDEVRAAVSAREAAVTPPPPPPPPEPAPLPAPPAPPAPSSTDDTLIVPTPAAAATESVPAEGANSNKNTLRAVGILVAVALVIGGGLFAANALGGDDNDNTSAESSSTSADDPVDDQDDADDDISSGGSQDEFCAAMTSMQDIGVDAAQSMPSDGSTPDLEDFAEDAADRLKQVEEMYKALADSAPDELKADVAVLTQYLESVGDLTDPDGDAIDSFDPSDMDEYLEASENVAKYYYTECI